MLLLVAGLGGAIWYTQPLRSFRPAEQAAWSQQIDGEQKVPARLWQDPFLAVHNAIGDHKGPSSLAGTLSFEEPAKVIPVLVPGGTYADSIEERLRIRYAVVAGLAAENYRPEIDRAIGFARGPRRLPAKPSSP
ncbi:MAG: hypothetical protein ACI9EF_002226 [Pseudohongiellaceae bacterium]|jgi:hypothetical protein